MSIHFFLSADVSKVSLKRNSYNKLSRKHSTENLGSYLIDDVKNGSLELPLCDDEILQLDAFIDEQENQIEKAFETYSMLGLFGGSPIVSRDAKYNQQFADLPGYRGGAPKGSFLGVINGARKLKLSNRKDLFNSVLEELMQKSRLSDIAFEIVANEILRITQKAEKNKDLRGNNCLERERAAQLIEVSELLKRFVAMTSDRAVVNELKKGLVNERVEKVFDALRSDINTAALGTNKRIQDSDLVINSDMKRKQREETKSIKVENQKLKEALQVGDTVSHLLSLTKHQTSLQL